jgi:hypothetical protein
MFLEVEDLIMSLWGDTKTAKTTLAMSFPKPLIHFDFDQGFRRMAHRIPDNISVVIVAPNETLATKSELSGKLPDIINREYQWPVQWPGQQVTGSDEFWNLLSDELRLVCSIVELRSVLLDTGGLLWNLVGSAELQRKQQAASNRGGSRENIGEIEYRRPNSDMRAMISGVKTSRKSLCITHHWDDVYQDVMVLDTRTGREKKDTVRTGAKTWQGWKHMAGVVDLTVQTYNDKNGNGLVVPHTVIQTCGFTLAAEGETIAEPTFDKILDLINEKRKAEQL